VVTLAGCVCSVVLISIVGWVWFKGRVAFWV